MKSDSSDAHPAAAPVSESSAAEAVGGFGDDGGSGEERPRVADHRERAQLSSEERALLDRYSQDRPPHWD